MTAGDQVILAGVLTAGLLLSALGCPSPLSANARVQIHMHRNTIVCHVPRDVDNRYLHLGVADDFSPLIDSGTPVDDDRTIYTLEIPALGCPTDGTVLLAFCDVAYDPGSELKHSVAKTNFFCAR